MTKKVTVSVALTITLIAVTVTFAITWLVATDYFNRAVQSVTQKQATYTKLLEVDTYVRNNYYGEINNTVLNDLVAQGYLRGIEDPYATYYSEKDYTEMQEYEAGTRVGIGVEVSRNADGLFYIERVYKDSPAEKAGVQAGSRILTVDGADVKGLTSSKAMVSLLRGAQGTTLTLGCVDRQNQEAQYEVQRINYTAPTLEYMKCGDFGYIRISSFEKNTASELDGAVLQALADGAKGLVFDVRGNTGGQYQQVYNAIDYLAPRGTVAKSVAKNGTVKVLATSDDENTVRLPMAVITDKNTAAGAELFAASVRDLCGGSVVGETTAGKGMIQSAPQQLTDGSAISITTAQLLTGKDESFDKTGIVPDVEILVDGDNQAVNLFTPNPGTDQQILRALEVVRTAVGNNQLSIVYQPPADPAADQPGAAPAASSLQASSAPESAAAAAADGATDGSSAATSSSAASTSASSSRSSSSSSSGSSSRETN